METRLPIVRSMAGAQLESSAHSAKLGNDCSPIMKITAIIILSICAGLNLGFMTACLTDRDGRGWRFYAITAAVCTIAIIGFLFL